MQDYQHSSPQTVRIYKPSDIDDVISEFLITAQVIKNTKKIEYFNIPCAFDIETSSFYEGDEKRAIMYEWTLDLNGGIIVGRTWREFLDVYETLVERLKLDEKRRLLIFVHNLGFEFQFLRKWFKWHKVFAISQRKPIYAITAEGVEFRCSYLLSGCALAQLGTLLRRYPVEKMVGDLDYKLLRHSETPLTDKEVGYCVGDVRVVEAYLRELIDKHVFVTNLPLTHTGFVRRHCRYACYGQGGQKKTWKYLEYMRLMQTLQLEPDEYRQLKRAFQGGFTHANAFMQGKTIENVSSYDFTSSYIAVMLSEKFPMSRGVKVDINSEEEFRRNLNCYCCLFDVQFIELESSELYEHPLSASRCWEVVRSTEDNGRIVQADSLWTTITEQDFLILEKFYNWKAFRVANFHRYRRGYLPTDLVRAILKLYEDKTALKGVEGREDDYLRSKEMANASYGMSVTDICRGLVTYEGDEWGELGSEIETEIAKYNRSPSRFLFYPWGVWIAAYARRNLFTGIYEFKHDYIYSDTDSLKGINADKHQSYIDGYNVQILAKLERAMKFHGIDFSKIKPKTIEGVEKPLGVWDFEGVYKRFKTLGAKRYMTESPDGDLSLTVSGVNKHLAAPYLSRKYGNAVFDHFREGLHIPAEDVKGVSVCGKNTHTYLDDEQCGVLVDYFGAAALYYEKSSIHLEPTDYSLSLSRAYMDYLAGIRSFDK